MDYKIEVQKEDTLALSPAMIQIYQKADLLAQHDASILIYGESGAGKNHLAAYIQRHSAAYRGPFVHVYCNAVSDQLFASELFGYSPNAFTGASPKGKTGLLEAAQNGVILFDEINELSPENQALLLHFLQNKTITPIGSLKSRKIHARIISTSGSDLREMIREGSFRADLYYRICVASIYIPPLRERREEIPLFLRHFIRQFEQEYGCSNRASQISSHQMDLLCGLDWTGNLWELENLALRICLSDCVGDVIDDYLEKALSCAKPAAISPAVACQEQKIKPLREVVADFEYTYIQDVIAQSKNLQSAAKALGISYSSLCRKRAEYKMAHKGEKGQQ